MNEDERIEQLLTRGVENVYPGKEELKKSLLSGKALSVYTGIDPTGPTLHIGHGSTLLKLRELQDLGHKIILLIGDFTGRIGDPTDKAATRKKLTTKEIKENLKHYTKQAGAVLNMRKVAVKFNSKWLSRLSVEEWTEIVSEFTLQQMIERDMFQKRIKEGQPIHLHEFFYPIMQGYDSVAMNVDMEVGGNDQTFNMLVGRTMMKSRGKEKYVLTTKLLVDPTGKKMGKSEGNMVTLEDSPDNMFGKVMSWPDSLTALAFEICTRVEMGEVEKINSMNPRDAKIRLASEIVKIYHGQDKARAAEENFINTFSKKEVSEEMFQNFAGEGQTLMDILVKTENIKSKSEFRRLVEEGAVMNLETKEKITDPNFIPTNNQSFKIGKKIFIKIT